MTKKLRMVTTVILVLAIAFICCACGGKQDSANTNVDETTTQVSLRATVLEATDSSILVQSDQERYRVPNIKQMELQVGDLVEITYDGNIMETDPLQLEGVSKIALITSEDTYMNVDESKESAEVDTINPIRLPDRNEVVSIGVSDGEKLAFSPNTEGEADAFIDEFYSVLLDMEVTSKESINDVPVNKDCITISINCLDNSGTTLFYYKDKGTEYVEQPYQGIYKPTPALGICITEMLDSSDNTTVSSSEGTQR